MLPLPVPGPWSHCRESEKASRRDRRGRQLRLILRPGPVLLWRGQSQRAGAGPDERRARRLPRRRHRDRFRLRHQRRQGRPRRRRSDVRARRTTPSNSRPCRGPASRSGAARPSTGSASICARRSRKRTGPEANVAEILDRSRTDVLVSYLPVGSQQATEYYAEQALEAGCAFVNCIPVFIASDPNWRRRFETRRAAARRRRHQEPGRRDHRPPRAHEPVPRARRAARPHLPAQLRRQHRLPEHARAGAARVEEDLEDAGRDEPARHAARRRATSMSARAISCRG